jgi:FeS assembly SUF system protein
MTNPYDHGANPYADVMEPPAPGTEYSARRGEPLAPGTQVAAEPEVIEAMRQVYDPEIPVNIYDLGLIYSLEINEDGSVRIEMSLTAPGCPVAGEMPGKVAEVVSAVPGVGEVEVRLIWDPPWTTERMSEDAKLALGIL